MARQSSIDLDSPDRPFDNIINFRDVGRTINHFCGTECVLLFPESSPSPLRPQYADCGTRVLKEGILYRSARVIAPHYFHGAPAKLP